jgi:YtcA family
MSKPRGRTAFRVALLWVPLLLLTGCQQAPSFNVLGSYFPAWLFCLFIGMILTVAARALLRRYDLGAALSPPLLMYSCLTAFFTFALWLIFFRS